MVDGDHLIESSGLYNQSFVFRYHASNNRTIARQSLPSSLFAEGVTLIGDQLYCLSWRAGKLLVLDKHSLKKQTKLNYAGEGWGLATFRQQLLMSDGSHQLTLRAPADFTVLRRIPVTYAGKPLSAINDLTVDDNGLIWANVWKQKVIVAINPDTGNVVGRVNLTRLAEKEAGTHPEYVLNGIAWDSAKQGLWVTGKRWYWRYLIKVTETID